MPDGQPGNTRRAKPRPLGPGAGPGNRQSLFRGRNARLRQKDYSLRNAMIRGLSQWSLRNLFLVFCATLVIIALGIRAVFNTPVDAVPDLTENQVLVYAGWMGRG